MTNFLNKNDGKHLQKIENFKNWQFEFGSVIKFEGDNDDIQISLQLHIIATNLETEEEKLFAFQNGKNDWNYNPQQEDWDFYIDGSEDVIKSEGFSNMDENDDDLIEYLNEYLDEYNYASDYSIDDIIN
jgi:hypothetical protein